MYDQRQLERLDKALDEVGEEIMILNAQLDTLSNY